MRLRTGFATLAALTLMFAPGCGGGNGGSSIQSRITNIQGIWNGSTTSPADKATLNVQYTQTGTTLTGTTQLIVSGAVYTGSLTGAVTGNNISTMVNYGAFGIANGSLTVAGDTITGTSVRSLNGAVVDTAATTLTKSVAASSANVGATFTGTFTRSAAGSQALPFYFTITQAGDLLSYSGSLNAIPLTGSGAVIANTVTAHLVHTGSSDYTDIAGVLNGSSITGTTYEPGTNSGNNGVAKTGIFTVEIVVVVVSH